MKKITAILLGTLIASSAALAQTNQVLSRNAVGYIKTVVEAGNQAFVNVPFVNLSEAANTLSNVFPNASNNTQVSRWDRGSQQYVTYLRAKGTWGANGSNVIVRGDGIFVQSPANQEFFFMGEVPDRFSAPTTTVQVVEGITALGSAYPVEVQFTNTPVAQALPNGSQFSAWVYSNQTYVTFGKSKGAWPAGGYVLRPGEAFFVFNPSGGGNFDWQQPKPYTWP